LRNKTDNDENENMDEDDVNEDDEGVVNLDDRQSNDHESNENAPIFSAARREFNFIAVGKFLIIAHAFGVAAAYLPFLQSLDKFFYDIGIKTEVYLFFSLWMLAITSLLTPLFVSLDSLAVEILHIATLLETGTSLIIIAMVNFSLALLLSVFVVPFGIFINPNSNRFGLRCMQLLSLLINPLTVSYLSVLGLTWWSFSELSVLAILSRALTATMDAVTFAIVDSIIYGNWMYPVIATVFFPIWIMFFNVLCIPSQPEQQDTLFTELEKKTEIFRR